MKIQGLNSGNSKRTDKVFQDSLVKGADNAWGKPTKLGADLYRAALSEELLVFLFLQDEDEVSDARVRELLFLGREFIDGKVEELYGA
jgi:hypothetical protein